MPGLTTPFIRRWIPFVGPGLLMALGLGFVALPLSRGEMFYYWDNAQQHYPQTVFLQQALRSGQIPHWWPDVGSGVPTVAEGQAAHFQPLHLVLTLLLSPSGSLMVELGIYLAAAGVGTFLFLREFKLHRVACLVGGLVAMFGSVPVVYIRNIGLHRSLGFLPLAMLCAERFTTRKSQSAFFCAALVIGLQLLSGHPTVAVVTLIATTFYVFCRSCQRSGQHSAPLPQRIWCVARSVLTWGLAGALGIGVAAIQFLPQQLHVEQSIRQGGLTLEYANSLPAMLRYLPQWALPYAYLQGDWLDMPNEIGGLISMTPSSGMYLGAMAVVLPVMALWWHRRWHDPMWPLVASLGLAIGLALGVNTPLFPTLRALPGLNGLRFPSRFLMWASFCLACLSGFGLSRLLARSRSGLLRRRDIVPFVTVAVGILLLGVLFWVGKSRIAAVADIAPAFHVGISASVVLVIAALALAWAVLSVSRRYQGWALLAVTVFALSDLWMFRAVAGYAPAVPIEKALASPDVAAIMKKDTSEFRVMSLLPTDNGLNRNEDLAEFLQADVTALWDIDSADVWFSLFLKRHYAVRESIVWELAHSPQAAQELRTFLASWNVRYVVAPISVPLSGWTRVHETDRAVTWQNPDFLPRAYLVHTIVPENIQVREEWQSNAIRRLELYHRMVADWSSRLEDSQIVDNILADGIDFRTTAVVEGPDLPSVKPPGVGARVLNRADHPDRMSMTVQSDEPAFLVISINYYPGWSATVNGQPAKIWRTNYTSMGIAVPGGQSEVALEFVTPGFRMGAGISAISIGLCAVGLLATHRRNRYSRARGAVAV